MLIFLKSSPPNLNSSMSSMKPLCSWKKDGKNIDHGLKKITKYSEEKGFRKTHLSFLMLVHGISFMCTPHNVVLRWNFYYIKKIKSKTQKRITLGCLLISAKFNVFSQTHLTSSSPKIYVVSMNQTQSMIRKFLDIQSIIILVMNNR